MGYFWLARFPNVYNEDKGLTAAEMKPTSIYADFRQSAVF